MLTICLTLSPGVNARYADRGCIRLHAAPGRLRKQAGVPWRRQPCLVGMVTGSANGRNWSRDQSGGQGMAQCSGNVAARREAGRSLSG